MIRPDRPLNLLLLSDAPRWTKPKFERPRSQQFRSPRQHHDEYASQYEAILSIAAKIGCSRETLRHWVRQAGRDQGLRAGPTSAEQEKIKALEREVRELRQANEIPPKASVYFAQVELNRRRTTVSDASPPCPRDRVDRVFTALRPNTLWVSDFTYVATWSGFVYVAFVIEAFARRSVGWRASGSAQAAFVLDALEQALHDRQPWRANLIHHSDRGVQYVSIKYTERLAESGIEPSVGSVGDSSDTALAETVIGLLKTEVIQRRWPWRSFELVEFATLDWVDWFNNRRLLERIDSIPPAEAEAAYYAQLEVMPMAA